VAAQRPGRGQVGPCHPLTLLPLGRSRLGRQPRLAHPTLTHDTDQPPLSKKSTHSVQIR
jgi:hypothetical protein